MEEIEKRLYQMKAIAEYALESQLSGGETITVGEADRGAQDSYSVFAELFVVLIISTNIII